MGQWGTRETTHGKGKGGRATLLQAARSCLPCHPPSAICHPGTPPASLSWQLGIGSCFTASTCTPCTPEKVRKTIAFFFFLVEGFRLPSPEIPNNGIPFPFIRGTERRGGKWSWEEMTISFPFPRLHQFHDGFFGQCRPPTTCANHQQDYPAFPPFSFSHTRDAS